MSESSVERPWEELEKIAESGDGARLEAYLDGLAAGEAGRAMAHLDHREQNRVMESLLPEDAADLLEEIPIAQASDLFEHLPPDVAANILKELPSDEQADFIGDMSAEDAEALLNRLDPEQADGIRELARYEDDVAGGVMAREYLSFEDSLTVRDVINDLRTNRDRYADYDVQYAYVVDADSRLVGVLRLRDILLSMDSRLVSSMMIPEPLSIAVQTPIQDIADYFEREGFLALPVVDDDHRIVGVVRRYAVEAGLAERSESDRLKAQGIVGGEELRTMPLLRRSGRRLSWLSINIILNVVAASVIAVFEETLTAVIALAFFLPIISDMSGCSGNQAVAVSIRELTLGLVKPHELLWVWVREIGVGLINGAVLGALIGAVAFLWKGNAYLGLVVGGALAANTMVAVSIGGAVPLILKRFNMDPALASGPVLTTITDICGFFFVLGFATVLLTKLTTG